MRLTQAWDTVVEFSDRPFRDAATTSLDQWVENWAAYGFAADPPNAAITMLIEGSIEVTDEAIMTLTNPGLAADGALEFDAKFLLLADGDPAFFPTDLGAGVKPSFLTTHVFMDSAGAPSTPGPEHSLFLLASDAGELHDQGDGSYLLRLTQAWDTVVQFAERPFRDAAKLPLAHWAENWAAYGFAADPPNAAIAMLIEGSVEATDWAIVTLTNPSFAADGALEFDAEFLLLADGNPAFFPTDPGSGVKPSFLTAQVFIDSVVAATRFTDNGDGTITDTLTRLMWEKKDDNNAGGIHDKDNKYTWCADENHDYVCDGSNNLHGTAKTEFLDTLNNTCDGDESTECSQDSDCAGIGNGKCGFAGHQDWRLPEVNTDGGAKELDSLIDLTQTDDNKIFSVFKAPCPPGCTVPTCSCTESDPDDYHEYWSSTFHVSYPAGAWLVFFNDGSLYAGQPTSGAYVRAVRADPLPTPTPTPSPTSVPTQTPTPDTRYKRYKNHPDGTITDTEAQLIWEKKDDAGGIHDWDNQYTWCADVNAHDRNCDNPNYPFDGTAKTVFLDTLNNTCDGDESTACTHDGDCAGIGNGKCGHAGYRNWRLPKVDRHNGTNELDSLIDLTQTDDHKIFSVFKAPCPPGCADFTCSCNAVVAFREPYYWSSTEDQDNGWALSWRVNFRHAIVDSNIKAFRHRVRAVRDIPLPTPTPTPWPTCKHLNDSTAQTFLADSDCTKNCVVRRYPECRWSGKSPFCSPACTGGERQLGTQPIPSLGGTYCFNLGSVGKVYNKNSVFGINCATGGPKKLCCQSNNWAKCRYPGSFPSQCY